MRRARLPDLVEEQRERALECAQVTGSWPSSRRLGMWRSPSCWPPRRSEPWAIRSRRAISRSPSTRAGWPSGSPLDQRVDPVAQVRGEVGGGGAHQLAHVLHRGLALEAVGLLELAHARKTTARAPARWPSAKQIASRRGRPRLPALAPAHRQGGRHAAHADGRARHRRGGPDRPRGHHRRRRPAGRARGPRGGARARCGRRARSTGSRSTWPGPTPAWRCASGPT